MEGNPVRKALACFAAVALVVTAAGNASAQVTKEDAGCRATIQKNAGKLGATTFKTLTGCVKSLVGGKIAASTDCTTVNGTSDAKGKVAKAAGKVGPGIAKKCIDADNAAALAKFQPVCPSPASGAVANFANVSACQVTINEKMVSNAMKYILHPDATAILADAGKKGIAKCAGTIGKNAAKVWSSVSKARGKCQATKDKAGMGYDYSCSTDNGGGKLTDAINKAKAAIDAACTPITPAQRLLIHTCSTQVTGANSIGSCVTKAVTKNASGSTAAGFVFGNDPIVCPTEVKVEAHAGFGASLTNSNLDTGWTGLGHHADIVDGFVGRVNLACNADCSSCTVTTNCQAGNCRCSSTHAQCSTPFVQSTCPAANTCLPEFGPPLALSAGGSPVCVTNVINTELVGTANVGTGSSLTTVKDIAKVFLGLTQSRPCPTCGTGGVGSSSTCLGGANNGAVCTVNAVHPDFGSTSYQCQPSLASNISGSGLKVTLALTDGHVTLPFGDSCDAPLGASMCACGACSGDNSQPCNGDADCAALALGTCEKGGSGASRRPNNCADLSCEDDGNEQGTCHGGANEQDQFCDGFKRKNGRGVITCSTNADCTALDSECPGGGAGACGVCAESEQKSCFLNPVEATGLAGQDGAELVSTFCSPPTNNTGINGAGGIPGAGRALIDWDFTGYCPDGTTEWEGPGGANCP